MPELPEVETVRRGLEPLLTGRKITAVELRRGDLRLPVPDDLASRMLHRRVRAIGRRSKYLLFYLDDGEVMLAHLGMSGQMVLSSPPAPLRTHDHLRWFFGDELVLTFHDPRRFGLVTLVREAALAEHPLLSHLGPEPLEKSFTAAYLRKALLARRGPIKPALMDASLVVGVGNIYASESLFLAGIRPDRSACSVAPQAAQLVGAVRKVLRAAIASGGSTLRDYVRSSGDAGYFQHAFQVYGREGMPCFLCKKPIIHLRQGARATYYCAGCQE